MSKAREMKLAASMRAENGIARACPNETARPRNRAALAGGVLAMCGATGHLVVSTLMRRDVWSDFFGNGVVGTVSLEPAPDQIATAEAFWFSIGSFATPLLALGGLVTWLAWPGRRVPGAVGWTVAGWAGVVGILGGFDVGTAVLILVGVLIGAGDLSAGRLPRRYPTS